MSRLPIVIFATMSQSDISLLDAKISLNSLGTQSHKRFMTAHDTPRSAACIFTTQSHPRGLIIKDRALHSCMHLTQHSVPSEKDQKQKPVHTLRGVLMPIRASSDNYVQKEHQYSNNRNRKDTSLYLPDRQIFHYILQMSLSQTSFYLCRRTNRVFLEKQLLHIYNMCIYKYEVTQNHYHNTLILCFLIGLLY